MEATLAKPSITSMPKIPLLKADGKNTIEADLMAQLSMHVYLVGFERPKVERDNYTGKLGGTSNSPLTDEKGKPKMIYSIKQACICVNHEVAFLLDHFSGCPLCATQEAA